MNNKEILFGLKCKATGIGSVPHTDAGYISDLILEKCPDIPYWPQLAGIDAREGMLLQFTEKLPCIKIDSGNNVLCDNSARMESILKFYENLTANNYGYFGISGDYTRGFYSMLQKAGKDIGIIKGQVVGPVTFLYSVIGGDGKPLLFDDELSDAIARGLAMKAVWQAKEIKRAGKIPVIFFDEPAMSGFGSAFMPVSKEQVMKIFDTLIDTVREHEDVIVGMHCCGNSDWETLLHTKIDIINFDSFAFAENFVIYKEAIRNFLNRDGIIAWGAVPTLDYNESVNLDIVMGKLKGAMDTLVSAGIDRKFLIERSLYTPACGMGSLPVETAEKVLDLTNRLALGMSG